VQSAAAKLPSKQMAQDWFRAWQSFGFWIVENPDRFEDMAPGQKWGYMDGPQVYVYRDAVNRWLNEHYGKTTPILREWANAGYIETWTESNGRVRYDNNGRAVRNKLRPKVIKPIFND
jgi:hypothetical protein